MPDKALQDLPRSGDDVRDSAMFAGKIGWTTMLVFLGLGVGAIVLSAVKLIPFVGGLAQEGQNLVTGQSSADENTAGSLFSQ